MADLAYSLRSMVDSGHPRVVIFLGAGVDSALNGRPTWAKLVDELAASARVSHVVRSAMKELGDPIVGAEALRVSLGTDSFERALRMRFKGRAPDGRGSYAVWALKRLVESGIGLFATFNYSRDVVRALEGGCQVVLSQPRDFADGDYSRLWRGTSNDAHPGDRSGPKTVRLLALHGCVDPSQEHMEPVADLRSYGERASERAYTDLLSYLLGSCRCVSIGFSWTDPLVVSAAMRSRHGHLAPRHIALMPIHPGTSPVTMQLRERAWVSALGVRPVYYSVPAGDTRHQHIADVVRLATSAGPEADLALAVDALGFATDNSERESSLLRIGALLDSCGDYESGVHKRFFAAHYAVIRDTMLAASPTSLDSWLSCAAIERHLRHFVWVYSDQGRRASVRAAIWLKVADACPCPPDAWPLSHALGVGASRAERVVFEFALGAYEVFGDSAPPRAALWRDYLLRCGDAQVRARAELARQLWRPRVGIHLLRHLRLLALECGWESIEAKLALDLGERLLQREMVGRGKPVTPRDIGRRSGSAVASALDDASVLSNSAGAERRKVGSVVLRSMVRDAARSEHELVTLWHGVDGIGEHGSPVSQWAICAGLSASLLDRGRQELAAADVTRWLEERVGRLPVVPAGTDLQVSIPQYWKRFHPGAARILGRIMDPTRLISS
jgi:hypothetical protein